MASPTLLYIAIVVCLPHSGGPESHLTNAIEAYSEVSATSKLKSLVRGACRSGIIKSPCDVFIEALVEITSIPVSGTIIHAALSSPTANRRGAEQSTRLGGHSQIRHCTNAVTPPHHGTPFLVLGRIHGVRARKACKRRTKRPTANATSTA